MNWKKIVGIIAGLAVIAFVVYKLKINKEIAKNRVFQYNKEEFITITADTLQLENTSVESSFTGTFEPFREAKISAEQSGKINQVLVDEGSSVSKGQTLVQLDNALLQIQLQSAEVEIEGLEKDVNRYTILAEADAIQGIQLEKAELGLKKARLHKATLSEQIAKSTIKAPFDGVVTAKLNEEGAFAAPGIPLLQITDIHQLKFTINIPESDLRLFSLNQYYPIALDVLPEANLKGEVVMIGSKANRGNSFPVQFLVKNTPEMDIKSGMFGAVILSNDASSKDIVIPASAITGTADQPQVYLVENGMAVLQNITISGRVENKAIISSGLKEGDVLVTSGFVNLFENANVTVK